MMLSLEWIEVARAMQCLGDVSWVMGYFHEISRTLLFMLSGHVGIGFSEYVLRSCRSYTLKVCYVVRSWGSGNLIFIRGSWGSWIFWCFVSSWDPGDLGSWIFGVSLDPGDLVSWIFVSSRDPGVPGSWLGNFCVRPWRFLILPRRFLLEILQ